MPIHRMNLSNGVFTAKQVGYVDKTDGQMWSNTLRTHAKRDPLPMTAVVDMTEATRICPTFVKWTQDVMKQSNVTAVAVVIDMNMASLHERVISKLSQVDRVRVFYSLDEAHDYARARLTLNLNGGSSPAFAAALFSFA